MLPNMSAATAKTSSADTSQGLMNLLFNVIVPALILNKGSEYLGPLWALLIALAFPLGFGLHDLLQKQKLNPLSTLGFLNVLVTGGLALLGLGGIWFSIKEAFFPLLIGIFVWLSSMKETPLVKTFLLNPQTMHVELIEERLKEKNRQSEFTQLLQFSTRLLAASFFLSAILNFVLAERIFTDIDPLLDATQKSIVLNQQIGQMTTWSAGVIVIPSTLFLIFILWHLLKGIRQLTDLSTDQILRG